MNDINEVRELAQRAARSAGEVLLRFYGSAKEKQKSSQDLVTEADIEAERVIKELIHERFPEHQILGEEGGASGGSDNRSLWIVDPLDGTNNYAHGIPQFSVSVAFAYDGIPTVGAILDPLRDELFTAALSQGAKLNGRTISVSNRPKLTESIISTGFYYDRGKVMEQTLNSIHSLFKSNVRGIRRLGSAALDLAWVACGRVEGFFEYQLSPWDYAAGMLLVSEAGGDCFDRVGNPLTLESGNVLVTNGKITDEVLQCVRWHD